MNKRVVLITGASRGVGKGTALALAKAGTTLYITGRPDKESAFAGGLEKAAQEINALGGEAIPVFCNHARDEEVKSLFEQIKKQSGRLDILVNNVFKASPTLTKKGAFWEKPLALWDDMVGFALRAHYVASYYAAPLMISRSGSGGTHDGGRGAHDRGLIVNISSYGARCYMHGPAYGIGKVGGDKLATDIAEELKEHHVASISLWLSMVRTEQVELMLQTKAREKYAAFIDDMESVQFAGRVIDALFADPDLLEKSGKIYIAAELARTYNITDIDGSQPKSWREVLGSPVQPAGMKVG